MTVQDLIERLRQLPADARVATGLGYRAQFHIFAYTQAVELVPVRRCDSRSNDLERVDAAGDPTATDVVVVLRPD